MYTALHDWATNWLKWISMHTPLHDWATNWLKWISMYTALHDWATNWLKWVSMYTALHDWATNWLKWISMYTALHDWATNWLKWISMYTALHDWATNWLKWVSMYTALHDWATNWLKWISMYTALHDWATNWLKWISGNGFHGPKLSREIGFTLPFNYAGLYKECSTKEATDNFQRRALSRKRGKSSLILRKCAQIVAIYWLNFTFKMHLLSFSRMKTPKFFPAGPVFLVLQMNQSNLIQENSLALINSRLNMQKF